MAATSFWSGLFSSTRLYAREVAAALYSYQRALHARCFVIVSYARLAGEYTPTQEQQGSKTIVGYVPVQDVHKEKSVETVEVPSFIGQDKAGAKAGAKKAGITLDFSYAHSYRTGKEQVVSQKPEAGMHAIKGTPVTATLDDKDMASAMQTAEQKIGEANAALREVQSMGIDTSDLAQPMQTA
jgi:hypothetical protein